LPNFIDKNLKCHKLAKNEVLEQIKTEIENKLRRPNNTGNTTSSSIDINTNYGKIRFVFSRKLKNTEYFFSYPYPSDSPEHIKRWLFEEGVVSSRDGESMKPQVKVAEDKGADYLMCRIPFFRHGRETFYDYVKLLFSDINLKSEHVATSSDTNIGRKLSGLILFTSLGPLSDDYIIVHNENVKPKIDERVFC
jgi:hypothetical protein